MRITPAPAGNIIILQTVTLSRKDHPRACGEHMRIRNEKDIQKGSPPRLRGTSMLKRLFRATYRITPAPAGNMLVRLNSIWNHRDHPRACGEHGDEIQDVMRGRGSPPRLRGTLTRIFRDSSPPGITPAPAGNMCICQRWKGQHWDHPRACGEHTTKKEKLVKQINHTRACGEHKESSYHPWYR